MFRAVMQTFALSFPADIAQGASTFNSTIGLQGNLQRLLDRSHRVRVHLGTTDAGRLTRCRGGWLVETPAGRHGPAHPPRVVLNAPPRVGRQLLRRLPGFGHVDGAPERL